MSGELVINGVGRTFGALKALDDVTLTVRAGARHAVIGPNGAGKSTLFAVLSGRLRPSSGTIHLGDCDTTGQDQIGRARAGIQQTFQNSSLFVSMSAIDNVAVAVQQTRRASARWWRPAHRCADINQAAAEFLDLVGLRERHDTLVRALSHGERRQLEIALALAREPSVLLLDEPTAGMSAAETARFVELVSALPEQMTVLLVEHDIDVVFSLATDITVLHLGRVLASGPPNEIAEDESVQAAYLSGAHRGDVFMTLQEES